MGLMNKVRNSNSSINQIPNDAMNNVLNAMKESEQNISTETSNAPVDVTKKDSLDIAEQNNTKADATNNETLVSPIKVTATKLKIETIRNLFQPDEQNKLYMGFIALKYDNDNEGVSASIKAVEDFLEHYKVRIKYKNFCLDGKKKTYAYKIFGLKVPEEDLGDVCLYLASFNIPKYLISKKNENENVVQYKNRVLKLFETISDTSEKVRMRKAYKVRFNNPEIKELQENDDPGYIEYYNKQIEDRKERNNKSNKKKKEHILFQLALNEKDNEVFERVANKLGGKKKAIVKLLKDYDEGSELVSSYNNVTISNNISMEDDEITSVEDEITRSLFVVNVSTFEREFRNISNELNSLARRLNSGESVSSYEVDIICNKFEDILYGLDSLNTSCLSENSEFDKKMISSFSKILGTNPKNISQLKGKGFDVVAIENIENEIKKKMSFVFKVIF